MLRMQKKSYRARPTIGTNGIYAVVEIACTCGLIRQLWNYQTVQTGGSASSSMENWQRCTPVAAQKMETTIQVCPAFKFLRICFEFLIGSGHLDSDNRSSQFNFLPLF